MERSRRTLFKYLLRTTDESEYDETFLKSFDESITNALKDDTLHVVSNAMSKRKLFAVIIQNGSKVLHYFIFLVKLVKKEKPTLTYNTENMYIEN